LKDDETEIVYKEKDSPGDVLKEQFGCLALPLK